MTLGAEILNGTVSGAARAGLRVVGSGQDCHWPSLGLGGGGRDLSSAVFLDCSQRRARLPASFLQGQSEGSGITWQRLRLKPHLIKSPKPPPKCPTSASKCLSLFPISLSPHKLCFILTCLSDYQRHRTFHAPGPLYQGPSG